MERTRWTGISPGSATGCAQRAINRSGQEAHHSYRRGTDRLWRGFHARLLGQDTAQHEHF
jgi:hypothetical protein